MKVKIFMDFYLEKKYSIFGTSYYLVWRVNGPCYGATTSPYEFLNKELIEGTKFKIVNDEIMS